MAITKWRVIESKSMRMLLNERFRQKWPEVTFYYVVHFNHRGYQGHVYEIAVFPFPPPACFPVAEVYPRIPRPPEYKYNQDTHGPITMHTHKTHTKILNCAVFSPTPLTLFPFVNGFLVSAVTGDYLFRLDKRGGGEAFIHLLFKDYA